MKSRALIIFGLCIWFGLVSASAQDEDSCDSFVQEAYALTQQECESLGIDEVCYGNINVEAILQPAAVTLAFNSPGDRLEIENLEGLRLKPMDDVTHEWGIALMSLSSSELAASDEAFEVVLFGDVEMDFNTTQAFVVRTGTDEANCAGVPNSGLLIQTPQGAGKITLLLNEVVVDVGSTVYVQADSELHVYTLEGAATITSGGQSIEVDGGYHSSSTTSNPPDEPQITDYETVNTLPLSLLSQPLVIVGGYTRVPTGIRLSAGQQFRVSATGTVNVWNDCDGSQKPCPDYIVNPTGMGDWANNDIYPKPDASVGTLLGYIGNGDPFVIGEGGTFTAEQGGVLYLQVNDDAEKFDNTGSFTVIIEVLED